MTDSAVKQEIEWTQHICGDDILGIPPQAPVNYTQYLADLRLRAIGLQPIYGQTKNPYSHLEKIANASNEGNVKGNFFESTTSEYNMSTAVDGWDDL